MTKTKSYLLTGIDPDLWKEFKSACAHYNINIKRTLIQKIEAVVSDYDNALINRKFKAAQRRKGVKNK